MPEIKEEDLLSLHYQIEKSEVEQKKLEDLLELKSSKLKKTNAVNRSLTILSTILILLVVAVVIYAFTANDNSEKELAEVGTLVKNRYEVDSLKLELKQLKKNRIKLQDIKNLYLYRKLIMEDTIYSVQIQSFRDENIKTISDTFTNTLVYEGEDFFKLSLGLFETLEEAQTFRKQIIRAGFSKKIFVISYYKGKRIKIENPF